MGPTDGAFLDEVVPDALDGERVDRVVSMLVPCSRGDAARAVADGDVLLAGSLVSKPSQRVSTGDRLVVEVDPVRAEDVVAGDDSVAFGVVHLDDDVIVVDKPAGLVVHPGPGHRGTTLVNGLVARFPDLDPASGTVVGEPGRPGLVHRLDRGTSGLLVVARTPQAHASLVEQLQTHSVERVYTALVRGHPTHPHGVIDAPVGRSRRDPLRMTVAEDGRPARTHFRVDRVIDHMVEDDGRVRSVHLALLTCQLETGRTHQIRVHLSSVGHPVVGDPIYGGPNRPPHAERPFLHARRLCFVHPTSGETLCFDSPLPEDLAALLARFRP